MPAGGSSRPARPDGEKQTKPNPETWNMHLFISLFSVAFFLLVFAMLGYAAYRKELGSATPPEADSFGGFLPGWLKQHPIPIALGVLSIFVLGAWASYVVLIVCAVLWFKPANAKKVSFSKEKDLVRAADDAAAQWLQGLGPNHAARVPVIEAMFTERSRTLDVCHYCTWQYAGDDGRWKDAYYWTTVSRSLAAMDNKEREFLRIAELLNSSADGGNADYRAWRFALVWGQGKGASGKSQWHLGENHADAKTPRQAIDMAVERCNLTVDNVITKMLSHIDELKRKADLPAGLKDLVQQAGDQLVSGGSTWLRPADVGNTVFAPSGDYVLHIGSFADGTPLTYSGEGSIVTIAPPGSGKTQCNVFPNLLSWQGPAVVLDVSGDIYENTSKWRAEHVGPVFRFNPLEPDQSHHYNPLAFVRSEPEFIWEDARLLADMMIVPSGAADPFWENEARTVLCAAIASVCYQNPPDKRPMHAVLDVMFGGEAWDNMLIEMRTAVDVRVMIQTATALGEMPEKTRASVLQTARSSLNAWTGERVARVTDRSDWSPEALRSGANPTIYIVVPPNAVDAYLSLLRVFIGQHIRMLTGGKVPARGSAPILIMLDELPRLKEMPPVDEALNIGRKYGLRLWMFAQSVGQLRNAYKNADGMLGSCAVRIFMNPSGADGLAERLSDEIGFVDALDGSRKKLVEGAELAGPNYREQQIVFGLATRPARVSKDYAWRNADQTARMGSV
jgi:type IV secretion system protein VirD4